MIKLSKARTWSTTFIRNKKAKFGTVEDYIELTPEDDSPYPEVRAAVPNMDNPAIPQNTLRMWVIGLLMTTLGSALTVLFSLHSPIFQMSPYVSSIAAWPLGRLWDRYMPRKTIFGVELNPGYFNVKEHALITIMANVSFGGGAAYITSVIVAMQYFYKIDFGFWFEFTSIIATQAIGYSIAGLVRRVLVYPASMIWPSNLVTSTFLTNIHMNVNHKSNGWSISRLRFFAYVLIGGIVWSFLPQYIAPCLSYFSIGPWLAPDNVVINQLFGTQTGLGMLPITFDWNQIAGFIGSPLIPPYFAIANVLISTILIFWIVAPIIHYTNVWYGHYLPMGGSEVFDRFQKVYDVSKVMTSSHTFDAEKYQNYSPLYFPTSYILSYCMSFAAFSATVVHTVLYDGKDILYYWTNSKNEPDDVHMRLIRRYKEVPDWWFAMSFLIFFTLAIVSVRVWDTQLPIWALILALVLAVGLLIPVAMVYALTNIRAGLNVVTEFIIGYMLPGKPVAMMMFKTFGYITNSQAVTFLQDMKLGHYLKIAPRLLFAAQLTATIWGCLVQLAVMKWAQVSIPNLCQLDQPGRFTCPQGRVFYSASVVWGLIGTDRQFSKLYSSSFWWFFLGAILPLVTWLFVRRYPKSIVRLVYWPAFFNAIGYLPPATVYNYMNYCVTGHIFAYWIKRTWFNWWAKYNYTLSAGLDLGLALGTLIIFLVFSLPNIDGPPWWGALTGGSFQNVDNTYGTLKTLKPGESFGASEW